MNANEQTTRRRTDGAADNGRLIHSRSDCPHMGGPCQPGQAICARLAEAIDMARPVLDADFELCSTVSVTDCQRKCLLAVRGTLQAVWCFGDVTAEVDMGQLIAESAATICPSRAVTVAIPCTGPLQ